MPISTAGIGEALQRSAAALHASNTSLSESIALVTSANAVLQNPEVVGTAFKTMSARIRSAKTELSELGLEEEEIAITTSELRDKIKGLTGFDIMKNDDEFKSIYEIMLGIGKEYDKLKDTERSSLAELMFGKRNINVGLAVLQNTEMLEEAYQLAEDSAGSAEREQENYMKSIQYSLDRFTASWQELQADLVDSGFIKLVVDTGTTVVNILDKIVEGTHGVAAGVALMAGAYVWVNKVIKEGTKATVIDTAANEANAQSKRDQAAASALRTANNVVETESTVAETSATVANTAANEANIVVKANQTIGQTASAAGTAVATGAKTAAAGIKSVGTAVASTVAEFAPLLVVVGLVMAGVAAIADAFTITSKEAKESLDEARSDLSNIKSDLEDVSSKIDEIQDKLNDKNYLSVTDPEDIERLKAELGYLEQRKEFLEKEEPIKQDSAAKSAYDTINSGHGPFGFGESDIEKAQRLKEQLEWQDEEIARIEKEMSEMDVSSNEWAQKNEELNDWKEQNEKDLLEYATIVDGMLDLRDELAKDSQNRYSDAIQMIDDFVSYYNNANDSAVQKAEDTVDELEMVYSNIDILSGVQKLTNGMDQLDKIYADVLNKEDFDFSSLLNNESFTNAFGNLDGAVEQFGDAYTNFVETVANSPDDIEATQEAFNNLASAYIYSSAQLDNVNEETKDATVEMLKQMGVVNAEEVVTTALANNMADLAFEEDVLKANSIDLTSITSAEIAKLEQEGKVSSDAADKISLLAMQKQFVNRNEIWTANDVQQLVNLAEQAGITGGALEKLAQLKAQLAQAEKYKGDSSTVLGNVLTGANAAQKIGLQTQIDATAKELQKIAKTRISKTKIEMPQIQYGGGSATQSAIDKAAGSAKEDTEELFDYFERRVEVLNQAIELLGANLENVLGSVAKNQLLDSQRGIYQTELSEYASALEMYQAKANEFLVKLPADIQQKITNGAVALQDFVGDSEGEVLDAIKSYQEWANKVADCTQKLAELKETLRQLELQKFNNIVDEFSARFDIRQNTGIDLIEKQISLFEEAGEAVGRGFYDVQAQQTQLQLEDLNREKELLIGQLQSAIDNGVSAGTDEWEEMVKALADVDSSILEAKTSLEKFDNAILKLHTETFDRIQKRFDAIGEEISAMDSFFEEADVANEGNQWTNEGLARLGLQTQAYELATRRVQQYNDEIAELGLKYMDGKYSAREYTDELDRLKSEQLKEAQNAESAKKSIMELNRARVDIVVEGINKEVEAYKKLTDEMVKALDAEEDLHDYQQSIAESNKDITKLERKIAAMQNDSTSSTVAKRKKLEEELAEARAQLAEKQHDHDVETRKNALNEEYENYEEEKNAEIEKLQESLKEQESIIAESFETVKLNAQAVGETISAKAQEHGVQISTALTDSWGAGEGAIASYGTVLDEKSSAFVLKLGEVETSEWNIQTKADNASVSIANLFGQKADGLITELNNANISAQNLAGLSSAIRSGFQNAFSEYNTSGIIGSLNAVKQAAEQTASALRDAQAMDTNSSGSGQSAKDMYQTPGEKFNAVKWNNPAQQKWRKTHAYATGGHKLLNDELAWTQELGDEVILSPTRNAILTPLRQGDSVLTAKQSEALFQWAKTSPAEFMRKAIAGKTVIPESNVGDMKLEIGNVLTVNGNIDDTNVKRMESVAQDAINKAFVQLKNGLKR